MAIRTSFDPKRELAARSVCGRCVHAQVMRSALTDRVVVYCSDLGRDIRVPLSFCSSQKETTDMDIYEMRRIHWSIEVDKRGVIGFRSPEVRRARESYEKEDAIELNIPAGLPRED